jgi:antirestriction protein ArdC
MATKNTLDPYQEITNRMIALIESGEIEDWTNGLNCGAGMPANAMTGAVYRGINVILALLFGRGETRFLTSKQAAKLGGRFVDFARDEQIGVPMVRFGYFSPKGGKPSPKTGEARKVPFLRRFRVWPVSCFEGLDMSALNLGVEISELSDNAPIAAAESILARYHGGGGLGPVVSHARRSVAFYAPHEDMIGMPIREQYESSERYYKTRFHEACHSTGHKDRLAREPIASSLGAMGEHDYSKEELIAELGAAMLCGQCGILPAVEGNSAAYLRGWLKPLKEDPKFLVTSAWAAQKAVDHVTGYKWTAPSGANE